MVNSHFKTRPGTHFALQTVEYWLYVHWTRKVALKRDESALRSKKHPTVHENDGVCQVNWQKFSSRSSTSSTKMVRREETGFVCFEFNGFFEIQFCRNKTFAQRFCWNDLLKNKCTMGGTCLWDISQHVDYAAAFISVFHLEFLCQTSSGKTGRFSVLQTVPELVFFNGYMLRWKSSLLSQCSRLQNVAHPYRSHHQCQNFLFGQNHQVFWTFTRQWQKSHEIDFMHHSLTSHWWHFPKH